MKTKKPTKEWQEKAIAKGKGDGAPVVTHDEYRTSLMKALGYYNLNMDNSQRAKVVLNYLKKNNKTYYEALVKAPDYEFLSLGSIITILNKGEYLSEKDKAGIDTKLNELYIKYSQVLIDELQDDRPKAPVISIEKRVIDAARTASEEIDYAIDKFIHNKTWDFSTKNHLLSNNVSGMVAKKIGDYYKLNVDEIDEAMTGTDEQLIEGYSFLSKTELKKFRAAIQSIVDDCAQHQVTAKKPRAVKVKSPVQLVKKLKYMFKHDLLNLKSINPIDIIGTNELWVYNIKYRKLTNYTADDSDTLSVKGTTIINYSIAKSWTRTLRNPEQFFKSTQIGKRALNAAVKLLKTKGVAPNGRINEETILLGAF